MRNSAYRMMLIASAAGLSLAATSAFAQVTGGGSCGTLICPGDTGRKRPTNC